VFIQEFCTAKIDEKLPLVSQLKSWLLQYREANMMELEDSNSRQTQYRALAKAEKDKNTISKDKISLLVQEINSLREDLRTQKEAEISQKTVASQLVAYELLHKQDKECKKKLEEEVKKLKAEILNIIKKDEAKIKELTSHNSNKHLSAWGDPKVSQESKMREENENLIKLNEDLKSECQRIKDEMDETVQQLLVFNSLLMNIG